MNGDHRIIQKEDTVVVTPKHIHRLPVFLFHCDRVSQSEGSGFEESGGGSTSGAAGPCDFANRGDSGILPGCRICGVVATIVGGEIAFRRQVLLQQIDTLLLFPLPPPLPLLILLFLLLPLLLLVLLLLLLLSDVLPVQLLGGTRSPNESYGVHAADMRDPLEGWGQC